MSHFEKILEDFSIEIGDLSFSEVLRDARDKLGLMQYRAAEHMNFSHGRLKNLETGYFRQMPTANEINMICDFYCLSSKEMRKKARDHIEERRKTKKIRTIDEKN